MEICRKRRGAGDVETGWEKKNYDDPSSDSFSVLTTLKNRWTLFLNRRDSDYNPHVWFFFSAFLSLSFAFFPFRHDSGMPPQSQKKKCHTTDSSLMIYTYVYVYIHY